MTMHRAKGLEADVVFVYGGFNLARPRPGAQLRRRRRRQRRRLAGRPRLPAILERIKRDRDGEDQRLYYVALTRARQAALPALLRRRPGRRRVAVRRAPARGHWRLTGGYRHVNRRAARAGERARHAPPARPAPDRDRRARAATTSAPAAGGRGAGRLASRRRRRRADRTPTRRWRRCAARAPARSTTSYSRIKQAHGGYRPPTEMLDEVRAGPTRRRTTTTASCRGGAATGIFLHALLRCCRWRRCARRRRWTPGRARDDVRARRREPLLRRHGRDPGDLDARRCDLAHAALTAPLPVVGGVLARAGARDAHRARDGVPVPVPGRGGRARARLREGIRRRHLRARGALVLRRLEDAIGCPPGTPPRSRRTSTRTTRCKSASTRWRWCGCSASSDAAGYEARFGGTLYVFVRGLGRSPDAVRGGRPTFDEIVAWQQELATTLAGESA